MGKAARWFRGLLGMKKDKENVDNSSNSGDRKEKKRWSFAKSGKDSPVISKIPGNIPGNDSGWLRSYISQTEKEQTKHAIAAAAAVAAAQAAVAVVRLTSHGRGTLFGGGRERWAAVKIQTVFRAHLYKRKVVEMNELTGMTRELRERGGSPREGRRQAARNASPRSRVPYVFLI